MQTKVNRKVMQNNFMDNPRLRICDYFNQALRAKYASQIGARKNSTLCRAQKTVNDFGGGACRDRVTGVRRRAGGLGLHLVERHLEIAPLLAREVFSRFYRLRLTHLQKAQVIKDFSVFAFHP
jgi:hypothetical protein